MPQTIKPKKLKGDDFNIEQLTLDVGCGASPKGDVNGDLFTGHTRHNNMITINPKKIKNFIKIDAQFLPFKDKVFKQAFSFHCLEHLEQPLFALTELGRVTNGKITIRVPCWHFYGYIIDVVSLFKCFFGVPFTKTTKQFVNKMKCIFFPHCKLNEAHLWYVYFNNADEINTYRKYGIPYEHEFIFHSKH